MPLWPATWITTRRAVTDPVRLLMGVGFGLIFGFIYGLLYRDAMGINLFVAMVFSMLITVTSSVPWRVRMFGHRNASIAWILVVNGILSCVVGYAAFLFSILFAFAVFRGMEFIIHEYEFFLRVAANGLIYVGVGLSIVIGEESDMLSRRAAARERRLHRLAEGSRLVALRAQINPHFFFNALNTIAALIPTKPDDAERAVELLASALRPVLTRDQPLLNTLDREVDIARAYSEIEQLRLGDRLEVFWRIDETARERQLPSLSLQPLVENSVVHGASKYSEPFRIEVAARVDGGAMTLRISSAPSAQFHGLDPETMNSVTSPVGHAIQNIRERLVLLFGGDARLDVYTDGNGRAVTRMSIPDRAPNLPGGSPDGNRAPVDASPDR